MPSFSAGDDAAAARHARELADHRAQVERVVERGDAEGEVEAAVGEREPLAVGLDAQVRADALLEEARRGRARSAGRRRDRRRRTRSRAARGAATPSSSPRRSRARGRRGGRSGRAGAGSRARSPPRRGPPSRGRGSGTAAPRRSGRRPRTSPARGRARGHASSSRSFASMPGRGRVEQAQDAVDPRVAASAGAAGERRGECPAAGGADDEARDLGGGAGHAAPGRGATWVPRLTRPAPAARRAPARPPASAGGGP